MIEGIPDGWELVRVGTPIKGVDWIVNADKQAAPCNFETTLMNWVIIRKKPKQYRPFANAAEFEPHRDRWWVLKNDEHNQRRSPRDYDDLGYGDLLWGDMFEDATFDDGSPFGVEVQS